MTKTQIEVIMSCIDDIEYSLIHKNEYDIQEEIRQFREYIKSINPRNKKYSKRFWVINNETGHTAISEIKYELPFSIEDAYKILNEKYPNSKIEPLKELI